MEDKIVINKSDIVELIDVLELKLELIKEHLPEWKEESKKLQSLLKELQTETKRSENIGKLLKSVEEKFTTFESVLKESQLKNEEITILAAKYKSLSNKLIISFSLLGFVLGVLVNCIVGI